MYTYISVYSKESKTSLTFLLNSPIFSKEPRILDKINAFSQKSHTFSQKRHTCVQVMEGCYRDELQKPNFIVSKVCSIVQKEPHILTKEAYTCAGDGGASSQRTKATQFRVLLCKRALYFYKIAMHVHAGNEGILSRRTKTRIPEARKDSSILSKQPYALSKHFCIL